MHQEVFSPLKMLISLSADSGRGRITIQTDGTINEIFLREKLFDFVDVVIAPVFIGGNDTPSLIDGCSLCSPCELNQWGVLKLEKCIALEASYVRLRYKGIG